MSVSKLVDLQQLLELEGESLGNLSQHLELLGVRWSASISQDYTTADPALRLIRVAAWQTPHDHRRTGHGQLSCDLSGDWTAEEMLLSVLEVALRQLWALDDVFWPDEDDDIPF